jgi:hypothetical protein
MSDACGLWGLTGSSERFSTNLKICFINQLSSFLKKISQEQKQAFPAAEACPEQPSLSTHNVYYV